MIRLIHRLAASWRPARPGETPAERTPQLPDEPVRPAPHLATPTSPPPPPARMAPELVPTNSNRCSCCGDPMPFGYAHYCGRVSGYREEPAA